MADRDDPKQASDRFRERFERFEAKVREREERERARKEKWEAKQQARQEKWRAWHAAHEAWHQQAQAWHEEAARRAREGLPPPPESRRPHRNGDRRHGFGHGPWRGHGFDPRAQFSRPELHWRLFWWFGFSILLMGAAAGLVMWLVSAHGVGPWGTSNQRIAEFLSSRFERVWAVPAERDELARAIGKAAGGRLSLVDAADRVVTSTGEACEKPEFSVPVERDGKRLGTVKVCVEGNPRPIFLLPLGAAGFTLWMASMFVARRIGKPLRDLTRVTREIGAGKLKSRSRLGWRQPGELGLLAESINDMATRIEKQLADQRELVAAVSHEIRAPLSRLRVLTEILRNRDVDATTLDKFEREIVEIDSLVGDLLASSRLDFSLLTLHPLDAGEIATEALERAGLPGELLDVTAADLHFEADPTLVARALANLLDNAARHADGAKRLTVRDEGPPNEPAIVFEVDDEGPGFSSDVLPRAFEAFERGNEGRRGSTSLGLGLALVRRIAEAHGGAAWAENRPEKGARVAIRLSRKPPVQGGSGERTAT